MAMSATQLKSDIYARFPKPVPPLNGEEKAWYCEQIKRLLKEQNAVIVAHYYTDPAIQSLAEETGGCVSDSLEMARFGKHHSASTLLVAGVRFMGETAKILSPEKRVLMPTLEAECSLDIGCPPEEFSAFCDKYPDRTVVVYANTSAAVKARADWVVTSSIAVDVIDYLTEAGEKILWAPDYHLGNYIQMQTDADMIMWHGSCIVHDEFKSRALEQLKEKHPEAAVLVHPESPEKVIKMADAVGSTSQLIKAVNELPNKTFIVATDAGIFYKMRQAAPDKTFIEAPTKGEGATCYSCAHCPWMGMNTLKNVAEVLEKGINEIYIDPALTRQAIKPLQRMVEFANNQYIEVKGNI